MAGIEAIRSFTDLTKADNEQAQASEDMGQKDFLKLMTTQLKNQDPTKPVENGEFLSQMAQFSQAEGMKEMETSFSKMAESIVSNQALQAASLVGREVLAPGEVGHLAAGGQIKGAVDLPASTQDVKISIMSPNGELVKEMHLGAQPSGRAQFTWNGQTDAGEEASPGQYAIKAEAQSGNGFEAVDTLLNGKVESVTLGQGDRQGLQLGLAGRGEIDFSKIQEIK